MTCSAIEPRDRRLERGHHGNASTAACWTCAHRATAVSVARCCRCRCGPPARPCYGGKGVGLRADLQAIALEKLGQHARVGEWWQSHLRRARARV
jgi:hypothetical protein